MTGRPKPAARRDRTDPPERPTPAFAVVRDVAASWETYPSSGLAVEDNRVPGLLLHAAGPTDDGIRAIDVWESEEAWLRYQASHDDEPSAVVSAPLVRRDLQIRHIELAPTRHRSVAAILARTLP